ncbi:MAG TPA: hypothetical protein VK177_14390 [Flavobacteriales bacterium]|nr:hypothetical protein [Flavobacteriales bacterium]
MKRLGMYTFLLMLMACGTSAEKETPVKEDSADNQDLNFNYSGPNYEMINNCLRTTLSYRLQVEPRDYDSIATYYFHEIRDYQDKTIREKNQRLKKLKNQMRDSVTILSAVRAKQLEGEIDILQQEINSHSLEVIGYVFVHSFLIKEKDTMSAIFVMDQNCGYKELIKVKAISDPNPDDYIESIRAIER